MNRTYADSLGILKIILKNLPILSLISLIIFVDRAKSLRISKGNIDGNKQGLSRIIQNVIKNGLDHGEKKIRIVLKREQNRAVLRISNQVIASEQIDIEHVFDRFYKADAARSKTSTGLGLSIAREFVRRMNGEIGAKIEENEFIVEMSFNL